FRQWGTPNMPVEGKCCKWSGFRKCTSFTLLNHLGVYDIDRRCRDFTQRMPLVEYLDDLASTVFAEVRTEFHLERVVARDDFRGELKVRNRVALKHTVNRLAAVLVEVLAQLLDELLGQPVPRSHGASCGIP